MRHKYYLKANVTSNSTGALYGMAGAAVRVLSVMDEHVRVVTVEDRRGKRFPVNVDQLSSEPVFIEISACEEPEENLFIH